MRLEAAASEVQPRVLRSRGNQGMDFPRREAPECPAIEKYRF